MTGYVWREELFFCVGGGFKQINTQGRTEIEMPFLSSPNIQLCAEKSKETGFLIACLKQASFKKKKQMLISMEAVRERKKYWEQTYVHMDAEKETCQGINSVQWFIWHSSTLWSTDSQQHLGLKKFVCFCSKFCQEKTTRIFLLLIPIHYYTFINGISAGTSVLSGSSSWAPADMRQRFPLCTCMHPQIGAEIVENWQKECSFDEKWALLKCHRMPINPSRSFACTTTFV